MTHPIVQTAKELVSLGQKAIPSDRNSPEATAAAGGQYSLFAISNGWMLAQATIDACRWGSEHRDMIEEDL